MIFMSMECLMAHSVPSDTSSMRATPDITDSILGVFENFKLGNREKTKSILSKGFECQVTKDTLHKLSKDHIVDSLVFKNDEHLSWGYLKSIDLGYIKNVEFVMVIETKFGQKLLKKIGDRFEKMEIETSSLSVSNARFKDSLGGSILDNRFEVSSPHNISSFYDYKIELVGDYIILEFNESLPEVKHEKVVPKELYTSVN